MKQTDAAEALQNEMHRFLGSACDDVSDLDAPPCWTLAQRILASDWLAAREAAAEVRGAQAVLAAVESEAARWEPDVRSVAADIVAAARAAAAVTTSSAKSSDLATRVPQDESQRAAGGGA